MNIPIEGFDYYLYYMDFPTCTIGGAVMPNDDGTYSIFLNTRLSREAQARALLHELRHIAENDFYNRKDIRQIEK